jgi:hypothetical protein
MSRREIKHRFALVAIGVAIVVGAIVAGVYANYRQQREIKNTQSALTTSVTNLLRRDCSLVFSTAGVFADFVKREVQLREDRARGPASNAIRQFDRAVIDYWRNTTVPRVEQIYKAKCGAIKLKTNGGENK